MLLVSDLEPRRFYPPLQLHVLILIPFTWRTVHGQSVACPNGPVDLYAIADHYDEYLEMDTRSYFQLFGEDADLVLSAHLSKDPTCSNSFIQLQRRTLSGSPKNFAEFETGGEMISPDSNVLYFFCTEPRSNSYNHMVKIPPMRDYITVYFMLPVLVLFLCMSATFSGLNLAIMSFSISDLRLIQESDSDSVNRERAGDVLRLRRQSNFVLCTIVCGNCFCNTTITIITKYFGDVLGFSEYIFVELLATGLLLIFTEILPALIFTKNALNYASKLQHFVVFTMILTLPISWPLSKLLDKVLGKDYDDIPSEVDSEQLEGMREEGTNESNNFNEMMNVVKKTVELRQKRAEDVMTAIEKVTMISDDLPITQSFLAEVHAKGHSRLPVYRVGDRNKICGVLNIKDLMLLMDDEGRGLDTDLTAGTMLSVLEKRRKHCFVLNTMPVHQFMTELQQGCTMAIVVKYMVTIDDEEATEEESYKVTGIITLEDYIEEIVGEIFDEKDRKDNSE